MSARKWYRMFRQDVVGGTVDVLTSPPHMAGYRDSYRLRVASDGSKLSVDVFLSDLRALRDALNEMYLDD